MARKPVAPPSTTRQPPLPLRLYRESVWETPKGLGTADAAGTCECSDTCEYAYKDTSSNPHTPHAEGFCTHLAEHVGISGPVCEIIKLLDGTLVFGSRWEGGVVTDTAIPNVPTWVTMVQSGVIAIASIRAALTRIYAFDLFIHNTDRHLRNFLIRSQKNGHAVLAFDYSRAWICNGFPLPPLPFDVNHPNERTINHRRILAALIGEYIDKSELRRFLEEMKLVRKVTIKRIIEDHPDSWLTRTMKRRILSWWMSSLDFSNAARNRSPNEVLAA
jgi:hypothetical protein